MTAQELAEQAMKDRPGVTYRAHECGTAVGAWHGGRWVTVACRTIETFKGGLWVNMPHELFINGKPAIDPAGYGAHP